MLTGTVGSTYETPNAKAVRGINIFNHDSWPTETEKLLDYGAEELDFLLKHFSPVVERNGCDQGSSFRH